MQEAAVWAHIPHHMPAIVVPEAASLSHLQVLYMSYEIIDQGAVIPCIHILE